MVSVRVEIRTRDIPIVKQVFFALDRRTQFGRPTPCSFEPRYDLSQYLTNLMYKICFTISFISCLYMFRAHVLIIRRSKGGKNYITQPLVIITPTEAV